VTICQGCGAGCGASRHSPSEISAAPPAADSNGSEIQIPEQRQHRILAAGIKSETSFFQILSCGFETRQRDTVDFSRKNTLLGADFFQIGLGPRPARPRLL
jgi:hypothetical protein